MKNKIEIRLYKYFAQVEMYITGTRKCEAILGFLNLRCWDSSLIGLDLLMSLFFSKRLFCRLFSRVGHKMHNPRIPFWHQKRSASLMGHVLKHCMFFWTNYKIALMHLQSVRFLNLDIISSSETLMGPVVSFEWLMKVQASIIKTV